MLPNTGVQEFRVQEFRSSGFRVQEFRSSGFRSSGVQEFRSSGVQEFRSSGVQEFRSSGVQSSGVQEFRSSGVQEFRRPIGSMGYNPSLKSLSVAQKEYSEYITFCFMVMALLSWALSECLLFLT
jgi:hypothetical protein